MIKSLKKTYNDTLSFTKATESQLNTIIIHKIKWFNNNICPSGSLIIQFRQWKIQPDQFLKILIQPVTKCVIKVSQSVVKCYTNIWIYKTIWSSSSYSWNWTGLLYFRKHHLCVKYVNPMYKFINDSNAKIGDSDVGDIVRLVTLWWWLILDVGGRIIMLATFFVIPVLVIFLVY